MRTSSSDCLQAALRERLQASERHSTEARNEKEMDIHKRAQSRTLPPNSTLIPSVGWGCVKKSFFSVCSLNFFCWVTGC